MTLLTIATHTVEEVSDFEKALGYLRWQEARKLNAQSFALITKVALATTGSDEARYQAVDAIIDKLVVTSHSTKGVDHK